MRMIMPRLLLCALLCLPLLARAQEPQAAASVQNDAVSSLNAARALLKEGNAQAALSPADTAVAKAPNWIDAYLLRGDIHLKVAGPRSEMQALQAALDKPDPEVDYESIARSLKSAVQDYEKAAELSRDGTQQRQLYVSAADLKARAQAADAVAKDLAAKAARQKVTEAVDQSRRKQEDEQATAERQKRQRETAERAEQQQYASELQLADRARGASFNLVLIGSGLLGAGAALIYAGTEQAAGLRLGGAQPTLWTVGALAALAGGLSLVAASPIGVTNLGPVPPRSMWPKTEGPEPMVSMTELLLGAGFGTGLDLVAFLGVLAVGGIDPTTVGGAIARTLVVALLLALDTALRPLIATVGASMGNEFKRDRDFRRSVYLATGVQGLAIASIALGMLIPGAAVPLFVLGGALHIAGVPAVIAFGFHYDRDTYRTSEAPPLTPARTAPSAPGMRLAF